MIAYRRKVYKKSYEGLAQIKTKSHPTEYSLTGLLP